MLVVNRLFDRSIKRQEFNTLVPKQWVTETVIDCMFELLTLKSHIHAAYKGMKKPDFFVMIGFTEMIFSMDLKSPETPNYFSGQFKKAAPFDNPENYNKIFIPMCTNEERTHFSLLVIHHDLKQIHNIDSAPDCNNIIDIQQTREYKVKQFLCFLNKEYENYKLINEFNSLQDICPHGFQTNDIDCGIFTILHAEHISQKGIIDLNKKVKQNLISSKKFTTKFIQF